MSSPEQIIADAFNTEIVGHSGDYNGGRLTYSRSLDLALQGLAALRGARYAIVQLPENPEDWNVNDVGTVGVYYGESGVYHRGVQIFDVGHALVVSADEARVFAAALLAAADSAEANQ